MLQLSFYQKTVFILIFLSCYLEGFQLVIAIYIILSYNYHPARILWPKKSNKTNFSSMFSLSLQLWVYLISVFPKIVHMQFLLGLSYGCWEESITVRGETLAYTKKQSWQREIRINSITLSWFFLISYQAFLLMFSKYFPNLYPNILIFTLSTFSGNLAQNVSPA